MCNLEIIVEMSFSVKKKWMQHKVICLHKNWCSSGQFQNFQAVCINMNNLTWLSMNNEIASLY